MPAQRTGSRSRRPVQRRAPERNETPDEAGRNGRSADGGALLGLQRSVGNATVARMIAGATPYTLQRQDAEPEEAAESSESAEAALDREAAQLAAAEPVEAEEEAEEGAEEGAVQRTPAAAPSGRAHRATRSGGQLQRLVEFRPPGRGEASAFARRQELVDRLNRQSAAIEYRLDGQTLNYTVLDEAALTNFDRRMRDFIDLGATLPMRLITAGGMVGGGPLLVDSLELAYLDLDDMLACDDMSFQLNFIHILVERSRVRNYARRIGMDMGREFPRAHRAGIEAEAEHLRSTIGDPSIRFVFEEEQPGGRVVFVFRSRERYRVVHVFRPSRRGVAGGSVFILTRDNRRLSIDQLRAERAAAQAAPAPAQQ